MPSVDGLSSGLFQYQTNSSGSYTSLFDATGASGSSSRTYPSKDQIRDSVKEALANIPASNGKLSFADIEAYQEQLKNDLEEQVTGGLETLGVDLSQDVNLTLNEAGELVCANQHPDKQIIDRYLAAHPELADTYAEALKLSKLTTLAGANVSPESFRMQMQQSAMEIWFADNAGENIFTGNLNAILNQKGLTPLSGLQMQV